MGQRLVHFGVELLNDVGWGAGRHHDALPCGSVKTRHTRFGQRGQVRQEAGALDAGHSQTAQAVVTHIRQDRVDGVDHELGLACCQIHQARCTALIGNVLGLYAGLRGHHGAGQMRDGASARGAVVQCAWARLGQVQKLFDAARGQLRVDHQHHGHAGRQRHGREVFQGVVVHLAVERWANHDGRCVVKNRVAIGRGPGRKFSSQVATCAGFVVDDDLLTQLL